MRVTHFVARGFATGYINFFQKYMGEYDNTFVIVPHLERDTFPLKFMNNDEIVYVNSCRTIRFQKNIRKILEKSDVVIFSGLFEWRVGFSLLPKKILRKTFVHFWGGDFYGFRNKPSTIRGMLSRKLTYKALKEAGGFIFLIDGEYEKFKEITNITNDDYIARMPNNPFKEVNYEEYITEKDSNDEIKILLGNSAAPTNHTEDILPKLKDYVGIKVYCPLAYGDDEYRNKIIRLGKMLLGDRFIPITEFVDKKEYVEFLSGMDVGIFNHDRQQSMGNINIMLALGKKVYLRPGTSMWTNYKKQGWDIYSVDALDNVTLGELISIDEKKRQENIEISRKINEHHFVDTKAAWDKILRSVGECGNS
ncbi:MAG: hypothetical protein E7202_00805 [Selenomonas ruminantium]|jgi:hypothetical protein|nr:hypothetical protein [Selenomonas ruminantium]